MMPAWLAKILSPVLGVALLLALALAGYQSHRADKAELQLSDQKTQFSNFRRAASDQATKAAQVNAIETGRRLKVQSEVISAQALKTQAVEAAAGRAAAADGSLRSELARVAARGRAAASDTATAAEREAAATASAVLADLFGRCSERRSELARYADAARIAGETCQRIHEGLTP